jgi:hypothetical protein
MANTLKHSEPFAIYVMATGDGEIPDVEPYKSVPLFWVDILGDLGHCGDLLSGKKPYRFPGGALTWLTLAMIAYANECDFIYKEQDVLAFGPCVETMYNEIGSHGCIFGSCKKMASASSLMLVKHWFITDFVRLYLGTPAENKPDMISECKYAQLEKQYPSLYCRYSFGLDRDRPLNLKAPVWYAQKFTPDELLALREAKLIEFDKLPEGMAKFTNCL